MKNKKFHYGSAFIGALVILILFLGTSVVIINITSGNIKIYKITRKILSLEQTLKIIKNQINNDLGSIKLPENKFIIDFDASPKKICKYISSAPVSSCSSVNIQPLEINKFLENLLNKDKIYSNYKDNYNVTVDQQKYVPNSSNNREVTYILKITVKKNDAPQIVDGIVKMKKSCPLGTRVLTLEEWNNLDLTKMNVNVSPVNKNFPNLYCTCNTGSMNNSSGICECPAGTYNNGTTKCALCLAGQYSLGGASSCQDCLGIGAGTVTCDSSTGGAASCSLGYGLSGVAGARGTTCNPCPAGQYSLGVASSCQDCLGIGAGTVTCDSSTGGATGCSPGYGLSGVAGARGATCNACPAGQYSLGGVSACQNCSLPTGVVSCSSTTGEPSSCLAGYGFFNTYHPYYCRQCSSITYSLGGQNMCIYCPGIGGATTACNPSTGGSTACKEGYSLSGISGASATRCNSCPAGQYSPGGTSACQNCPGVGVASCHFSSGYTLTCLPGYGLSGTSGASNASCYLCGPGSASGGGVGSCYPCGQGSYSDEAGAAWCSSITASHCATTSNVSDRCSSCSGDYSQLAGDGSCYIPDWQSWL